MTHPTKEATTVLSIARFRVARPTPSLAAIKAFYGPGGLNLPIIGSFQDHAGYDGLMFGLPGESYHLEFTEFHGDQSPPYAPPSKDNLLVFYVTNAQVINETVSRLGALGYPEVEPENPYWELEVESFTIEDPDGWRVVLVNEEKLKNNL